MKFETVSNTPYKIHFWCCSASSEIKRVLLPLVVSIKDLRTKKFVSVQIFTAVQVVGRVKREENKQMQMQ